ncbi:MAG: hypothetical protein WCI64_09270 [Chlorobium sp.]
MLQAKQEVQQLLDQIPENVSFDDIRYHIYVCQKINRGLEDVESGNTISEEEMEQRMAHYVNH